MPRKLERNLSSDDSAIPIAKRHKPHDARLERKRELDRVAQRTIREKTKNHVANLERLVQALQADNESDGRTAKLVARLEEKTAEVNRLRNALDSIIKITNATCNSPAEVGSSTTVSDGAAEPEMTYSSIARDEERHDSVHDHSKTCLISYQNEKQINNTRSSSGSPILTTPPSQSVSTVEQDILLTFSSVTPELSEDSTQSICQMACTIAKNSKLEGRLWYLAGTLLNHTLKRRQRHLYSTAFDEDIAIRAVMEGWSAVIERYPLDLGWQWLKELDERIYFNSSMAVRLMHLRNCRLQFLHQMVPDRDWAQMLPPFFTARPSQRYLHHDPLVEHFPWPSFRERLVFSPRRYATNKFMENLQQNVNFIWASDPRELFEMNRRTGMYSYSEAVLRQLMDIRCYTMKPAFFDQFPELRADIPVDSPSPVNSLVTYVPIGSGKCMSDEEVCREADGEMFA